MVKCTFCGMMISPGTGMMYVMKEGKTLNFCSSKCKKNQLKLGRNPEKVRWTARYQQ